jgi:folylpolyglutamate synthase/dihydropteroate synthase
MSTIDWLESLSPWPADGFGLGRIHALLAEVGDPQLAYPSIHVVGTNGKSTTARARTLPRSRPDSAAGSTRRTSSARPSRC